MSEIYEHNEFGASEQILMATIEREYHALPEIKTLDEYAHFKEQLQQMRVRGGEYHPGSFGLEFALLMRLNDYCRRIGVPDLPMPGGD